MVCWSPCTFPCSKCPALWEADLSPLEGGCGKPGIDNIQTGEANLSLLRWRLVLAIIMSAASAGMVIMGPEQVSVPGVVAALGLLFTTLAACWAAALVPVRPHPLLVAQLLADTIAIGLLVQFTGGPFSVLPLAFCVPILLGAYFLGPRSAMALAGLAAVLTGGGHFGLALGWLLAGRPTSAAYLQGWPVMVTAMHMALFTFTGMVSSSLAGKIIQRRHQKQYSEEASAKARFEVRNILQNIRSGLLTVDEAGVVTRVNPAAESILGFGETELLGKSLATITAGGMEELAQVVLPVAGGGEPVPRGEIEISRQGEIVPLGLNVNPVITENGAYNGAIVIFTDLTKEKEMRNRMRESDRMAAVGELAASIAHEIRNPLASIRGSVEILGGELDLDGHLDQLLGLVLKESARVNTIINDFLAFSRMKPIALKSFVADEFFAEVELQSIQHVVAHGGKVEVDFNCQPRELVVIADPGQLKQLILNLVINACEAMSYAGRIDLTLRADGGSYFLEIHDTGPGIDPEIKADLFVPFKTTKDKGTGLGLAMVARIASAHGGQVKLGKSSTGGASFLVSWPRSPQENPILDTTTRGADISLEKPSQPSIQL